MATFLPMSTFGLSVDSNGTIWEYRGAQGFVPVGSYAPVYPPTITTAPVVTVVTNLSVGSTVVCSSGVWAGGGTYTYTRQWYSAGVAIPGATGNNYVLQTSDLNNMITCTVAATNVAGTGQPALSNAVGPVVS